MIVPRRLFGVIASIIVLLIGCSPATPEATFWNWFERNEASLFDFERDQDRTFDRLTSELRKVHPDLTFEFGPKKNGRREFVISADGIRQAFPKVESLASAAPPLRRWTIVKFRPRRDPFDIQYEGIVVKASSVSVVIHPGGEKPALTVFVPGYAASAHKTFASIAFLLLDQTLGEFDVETRVGAVDVQAPLAAQTSGIPLDQLAKAFDAVTPKR